MKNLQTLKKFAAIVLSAMMILSTFAVSSFADLAENTTMKITGIDSGDTVKTYKIVGQDSGTDGASNQWKLLSPYGEPGTGENADKWYVAGSNKTLEWDFNDPGADAINAVAEIARTSGTLDTANKFEWDADEEAFTSTGKAVGTWLVLAEPADAGVIYNPIVISRDYAKEKGTGSVEVLTGNEAGAKKTDIPFEKVVERDNSNGRVNTGTNTPNPSTTNDKASVDGDALASTGTNGKDGNRGDTAANGDTVVFRINTTIPFYADNYFNSTLKDTDNFTNAKFNVYDTLTGGLSFNEDVKVYELGKSELPKTKKEGDKDVELYKVRYDITGKTFKVEFTPAGVKEYRGKNIEVRYSADVDDSHGVNFAGEKNDAYPEYTRKPGEDCEEGPHKKTYHYTFTINGKINGQNSEYNREIIKIGKDSTNNFVYSEKETFKQGDWTPLTGVTFKLYKAQVNEDNSFKKTTDGKYIKGEPVDRTVISENGILKGMTQLDAGKYVLIEEDLGPNTQYTKNTTPIAVDIQATLDDQGRLIGYKVIVNETITAGDYTKEYNDETDPDTGEVTYEEGLAENGTIKSTIMDGSGNIVVDESKVANKVTYNGTTWKDTDNDAADIINTPVGTLPSTGGMGTVLFTVGGIAIMALAIFLLFGGKKKQEQK